MPNTEQSPLAGKYVTVEADLYGEGAGFHTFRVEDWWDRLTGRSWMDSNGNPAAMNYAIRGGLSGLPIDDQVLYGKVGAFGHLVHVSEIKEVQE